MIHKDYEPIKIEIFQSDLEKIMYQIEQVTSNLTLKLSSPETVKQWTLIKKDLQRKIDIHKERGEWK